MFIDENVKNQAPKAKGSSKGKSIEETYTKKTQLEHILLRPDTYIGSVEKQTQPMWVLNPVSKRIVNQNITFVPGLYKIFDEILVNASDNKQRDSSMNKLEVSINSAEGFIRVWNNGKGIPVVVHKEHKMYVPELIFGNLLTGSNFDDNEEKTTGGRNGYGAKLANIFSTEFIVETADSSTGLKLKQVFRNNMGTRTEPEISKYSGSDFTCITFYPDFRRFKMSGLDSDTVSLLSKRVFDMAGTNTAGGARLTVTLNGEKVEARNFEQYISLYEGVDTSCSFEKVNERWEVGVGLSDGAFQQVSFVNSICTSKGGCHVQYIADQVANRLMGVVKKQNKGQEVKPFQIKNHLAIYVNALIVNPAFDSQTKENLTTKASSFGSTCVLSEKFLKAIEKSGIVNNILNWAKFKQIAELKKKSGSKTSKLLGITKLDDANFAGTAKSRDCTLILTEGDSAKALAISGLSVLGRDYFGVFPLKGKLLNVREASHAQIMKNEEIQNIAKIMGLTFGKVYDDCSSLRYGHLMIMTDQDHDGSHIKGLLINFIHHFWPSLLQVEGFLQQFITPIVKATKGQREVSFYTIPEYHKWRSDNHEGKGWKIKYYKGLGTSTSAEAKEYFSRLSTHEIAFQWDPKASDMIEMAFSKKRVDDRKFWLLGMEPGVHIDFDVDRVTYDDFVNKELILFSNADNERSIPHFLDGLKPSQRKVLFSCFKRNLKQEIKVAQLAGYVSEHSAYHHGEASLTQTIIGMAQNFVGSNNINLLSPCGQFGTRLMGGKDAASPRYVFTKLEPITRCLFRPEDDPLLTYLDDDGQSIEPTFYVPVIPMVLVNGSEGIGTGWSTSVPTFNPRDIIANIRRMLRGEMPLEMHPWFRGFTGPITPKNTGSGMFGREASQYTVSGRVEVMDDATIHISELPVGKWTTDYKALLESMLVGQATAAAKEKKEKAKEKGEKEDKEGKEKDDGPVLHIIKDFKENHTDSTVSFTLTLPPERLAEAMREKGGLQKRFKLDGSVCTTNMHLFDSNSMIKKYESPLEVLANFYDHRLSLYSKRKTYMLSRLDEDWDKLDNKVRFILAVVAGKLVVSNRKKADLVNDLRKQGFKTFLEGKEEKKKESESDGEDSDSDPAPSSLASLEKGYEYLLGMKIWSLTLERVEALKAQREEKRRELEALRGMSPEDLWERDLTELEGALEGFEAQLEENKKLEAAARKKAQSGLKAKGRGGGGGGGRRGKAVSDSEDSDGWDSEEDKKKKKKAPAKKATATSSSSTSSSSSSSSSTSLSSVLRLDEGRGGLDFGLIDRLADEKDREDRAKEQEAWRGAGEGLSMYERLLMVRKQVTAPPPRAKALKEDAGEEKASKPRAPRKNKEVGEEEEGVDSMSETEKKPKGRARAAPKGKAPAKGKAKKLDSEAEESEVDPEDLISSIAASRPARSTAAKKVFVLDSEDEEDDDEEEEDEEDNESGDESEDEEKEESDFGLSDMDSDDGFKSKGKKASAPKTKATVPVPAKKPPATKPVKPAPKTTGLGVKRTKKSDPLQSLSEEPDTVYNPGLMSPSPMKKKSSKAKISPVKLSLTSLSLAANSSKKEEPKATKKVTKAPSVPKSVSAAPIKKAPKKSSRIIDSEDEEEEEVVAPRSGRTRKPVKSYAESSDGELNFDSEFDEDD